MNSPLTAASSALESVIRAGIRGLDAADRWLRQARRALEELPGRLRTTRARWAVVLEHLPARAVGLDPVEPRDDHAIARLLEHAVCLVEPSLPDGALRLRLGPAPLVTCRPGQLAELLAGLIRLGAETVAEAEDPAVELRVRCDRAEVGVEIEGLAGAAPSEGHPTLARARQGIEEQGGTLRLDASARGWVLRISLPARRAAPRLAAR